MHKILAMKLGLARQRSWTLFSRNVWNLKCCCLPKGSTSLVNQFPCHSIACDQKGHAVHQLCQHKTNTNNHKPGMFSEGYSAGF